MVGKRLPDVDWPTANQGIITGLFIVMLVILAAGVYVHLTEVAVFIVMVLLICLAVAVGAVGLYLLGALTMWTGGALLRLYTGLRDLKHGD